MFIVTVNLCDQIFNCTYVKQINRGICYNCVYGMKLDAFAV